jgi:hypothetical protein
VQTDDNSRIEELKKSLYSRTAPDIRTRRKLRFEETEANVKTDWERPKEEPINPVLNQKYEDHSMSFFAKLLIFSVIFCLFAVGIGVYIFLNGANLISANNIDISVSGPVSVPGGMPVSFDITVTNKNNVDLQLVDLSVNFPAGAANPDNPSQELTAFRELIGDIPAGQSAHRTIKAIIFGEENAQKQIVTDVTYNVKGSSSSFTKEKSYDVLINSSPVLLTVSSFKEITSGQEFDLKVDIKSNSQEVLKNVLLSASYPFGFTYLSSDLKSSVDNTIWHIGDIPPGGDKKITIHGKVQGEDTDTRVFHFNVGAQSSKNTNVIGTEYMSVTQEIAIQKPFVTVNIALDDDTTNGNAVGRFDQPVRVTVSWFNNLSSAVSDAEVVVKLSGSAYDKTLVQPGSGYFRSATDDIVWNEQTTPGLTSLGAGESDVVSFSVTPRDLSTSNRSITNPTLMFSASVSGKRTQETGVSGTLTAIANRTDRIGTNISLSGRVVRNIGPFANTGPIPPKSEQKSTYTIIWTIDNTANVVNNVQVTAKLPPFVKWTGQVNPQTEDISINKDSGLITWNVGTIGTYTANSLSSKEVDFQVSVEPSVNQVGSIPTIIGDATLTGADTFTGASVNSSQSFLSTRFSTDPLYREGQETVVQ